MRQMITEKQYLTASNADGAVSNDSLSVPLCVLEVVEHAHLWQQHSPSQLPHRQ